MTYKEEFITFMVRSGVLTFGDFTTKSGRKTPYFINTGNYKTGAQAAQLGDYYAACIAGAHGQRRHRPVRPRLQGHSAGGGRLHRPCTAIMTAICPTASTARRSRITAKAAAWWATSPRTAT